MDRGKTYVRRWNKEMFRLTFLKKSQVRLHFRSNHWRCSIKKSFLKNFSKFFCVGVSYLISYRSEVCYFIKKEILVKVFHCEFWEHLFYRTMRVPLLFQQLIKNLWNCKTLIWTGIMYKKIPCYMHYSVCRWSTVKNAEIFWSYDKHLYILLRVRN